jgi:Arc/MetJ-type ribon-helix-helix transcriptional regulator
MWVPVMHQAKISLTEAQVGFLEQYQALGYPDKSSLVRAAIDQLQKQRSEEQLAESADLYAEIYSGDGELSELTEQALEGWPE